ncbi:flagellar hook capping FlgD N-terminal domain-containing protein [uncultured Roseibium sp.]|uniref:flagellar hook assembly protein FlgD n=1 Tax=uncultured Roseibium sp. TaxID=1936171 RepID=UPI00261F4607|nr:flagellar hook capping FlgD N-terminal domain-containing protein [uncultured Roseibium sp.]
MNTVSSSTSATAQSSSSASQSGLIANYELFLSILTTQIQNQDPLDPMDSAEYTNQLVQYSNVEQSIQQNKNLEEIIASLSSNMSMSYVGYIGNEVTADASTTTLSGSQASWNYELSDSATGTYEIRNSSGSLVYTGEADLKAGSGTITWNGQLSAGGEAPDGLYTISFDVKDASSNRETVRTETKGIVDSVDLSGSEVILNVGGQKIPVSSVTSVSAPA